MRRNNLSVDMGTTRLYQKLYRANFDYWLFPLVSICSILLNLVAMRAAQLGNTLTNILLN
jgi:hypothetical protein